MIDIAREENLPPEERLRLYAARLQLWRLCTDAKCRRAGACRGDPRRCSTRLADWADAVKEAARLEFSSRNPETEALRAELATKLIRLSRTMADQG